MGPAGKAQNIPARSVRSPAGLRQTFTEFQTDFQVVADLRESVEPGSSIGCSTRESKPWPKESSRMMTALSTPCQAGVQAALSTRARLRGLGGGCGILGQDSGPLFPWETALYRFIRKVSSLSSA